MTGNLKIRVTGNFKFKLFNAWRERVTLRDRRVAAAAHSMSYGPAAAAAMWPWAAVEVIIIN